MNPRGDGFESLEEQKRESRERSFTRVFLERRRKMRKQWRPARGGSDERGNVGAQRVPAMHAHEGGNLGRRRKNARTVCYRLFPGKMGRDAGDPCRGDGSRDPTLCLKTVVSTRGRLLCSLPPLLQFARTKFHSLPVLDKKENPQFGSLDIVSSSKTGFLSLFVDSPRSISPLT